MKDFYSLQTFFADIDEAQHLKRGTNSLPTQRAPEIAVHTKRERAALAAVTEKVENLKQQLSAGDSDGKASNRRDCTCILELSNRCSVCAGTDDQEDPWNDVARRERLAEAEYEI